jgi:type II secretory pathway component PulF
MHNYTYYVSGKNLKGPQRRVTVRASSPREAIQKIRDRYANPVVVRTRRGR